MLDTVPVHMVTSLMVGVMTILDLMVELLMEVPTVQILVL